MNFKCTNCLTVFDLEANKKSFGYKCPNCKLKIKMNKVQKIFNSHKTTIDKLYNDIGNDNVKCFTTSSFNTEYLLENYSTDFIEKCGKFYVVTSGSADRNWLFIIPDRLDDVGGGSGSIDRDPFITFINNDNKECDDLALIARHQEFYGRVTTISGSISSSYDDLMSDLSKNKIVDNIKLEDCDQAIKNAVSFGAQLFRIVENEMSGSLNS
ncbi:MAG: hypothetical protein KAU01_07700 [Candidatus Cloacimonetes bacterium]|nr:hypothetical protein [Candidatus Cloacimonadota bacterium]